MDVIFNGKYKPEVATEYSAGFDIRAYLAADKYTGTDVGGRSVNIKTYTFINERFIDIPPRVRLMIPTGLRIQPAASGLRVFFMLCLRSSMGAKRGLIMPHGVGVIDADFTGEIMVVVYNPGTSYIRIEHMEKIAQLVPIVHPHINFVNGEIKETTRGGGGFGSTNK